MQLNVFIVYMYMSFLTSRSDCKCTQLKRTVCKAKAKNEQINK